MSRVPYNKLLTNLACPSRAGEYWPSVVFVRTSRCSVRTATTSGQYSPARPSRSVSERLLFCSISFTITAEIYARSLANFYCQYADRHMNLKIMRLVSAREPAIRQFVIVKNKLMSVFNESVLLLIMNFVITLSK